MGGLRERLKSRKLGRSPRMIRYLWQRFRRSFWRQRVRSRLSPALGFLMIRLLKVGRRLNPRSWNPSDRRLWLSGFLFVLAIGGTLWLDLARFHWHSGVNALNDLAESNSPVSPTPDESPILSVGLFETFINPSPQPIARSPRRATPSPVVTPTESVTPRPSIAPSATPSPIPTSTSTPKSTPSPTPTPAPASPTPTPAAYGPPYQIAWANPTNYGDRFTQDIYGKPLTQQPIIVLHETVYSANSAINYFQTPHRNEDDQASYHALIRLNGTIVYLVPPDKRAYGAGNSVFNGPDGPETARTHRQYPPSVNNFAYHISLETPADGANENQTHSGYTTAQYRSLAWLVAQSNVPDNRITTHRAIDRSGSRMDPRSFNFAYFLELLHDQRAIH